ncbi:MAG: hypothetical protein ACKVOW_03350 [Chitinophagaceae bacterium]
MLQIPNHQIFSKGKTYSALAQQYLPETILPAAISAADQQAVLQQLDSQLKKEQFYFITDVKTGTITYCNGINQWLGHTDAHFTQKKYLHIINPAHALLQGFYAAAFFDVLINKQLTTQFLRPTCISTLALKNKAGKYIYCKRQCYPFQITGCNKMTEYMSEFTIIKELTNEEYHTRINNEAELPNHHNDIVKKLVQKKFEDARGFSIQELRILKRYATAQNVTSETIAKAFKIEKTTVDTYNKRILKKAENILGQNFGDAKKVATYFKRAGLL